MVALRCIDAASLEDERNVAAYRSNAVAHFMLTRYQDSVRRPWQKPRAHPRRGLDDRPVTRELRGLAQAYDRARELLAAPGSRPDAARADASRIEARLGAA
ncbi:hypothetical protein [Paraburkholderia unamae]|uniref:hypothetical protein n=1 Tax=Paraburkholderia unamae TaxID=219649 RepID=UPI003CCC594D